MSFTDGRPRLAGPEDVRARWTGASDGRYFRCSLCGSFILTGETWRWVPAGGAGLMNFLAHSACCGDDPVALFALLWREARQRFWFLLDSDELPPHPETRP